MLTRPNYCCNCGERIERIEWHVWTSRRFCELCETEFQVDEWLPKIFGFFLVLSGLFGVGSYFRTTEGTLKISNTRNTVTGQTAGKKKVEGQKPPESGNGIKGDPDNKTDLSDRAGDNPGPDTGGTDPPRRELRTVRVDRFPEKENEPAFYCGAETKKGTPCSRRVRGGGRCWQHKGRASMLPQEELKAGSR